MGKPIRNRKLLDYSSKRANDQATMSNSKPNIGAFATFAQKVAHTKQKKIEKFSDTKQRLMDAKRGGKMLKQNKKVTKFALLDEPGGRKGLTHKGIKVNQLGNYNDYDFEQDDADEEQDQEFRAAQDKLNFHGFDEQDKKDKTKTKAEVYAEIIAKSRKYKHMRQEQFQENANIADKLDETYQDLVGHLAFRGSANRTQKALTALGLPDPKAEQKAEDMEFKRMMEDLRDDERVVSRKIVEKSAKTKEKTRKKDSERVKDIVKPKKGQGNKLEDWLGQQESDGDKSEQNSEYFESSGGGEEEDAERVEESNESGDDDEEMEDESEENQNQESVDGHEDGDDSSQQQSSLTPQQKDENQQADGSEQPDQSSDDKSDDSSQSESPKIQNKPIRKNKRQANKKKAMKAQFKQSKRVKA